MILYNYIIMSSDHINKDWYIFLKKKYRITDDDMIEYIDAFEYITKKKYISAEILADFINEELNSDNRWNVSECKELIEQINLYSNRLSNKGIDIVSFINYAINACQKIKVNKISARELFDTIDVDGDGKITHDELNSLLYRLNDVSECNIKHYKEEIEHLCKKINSTETGYFTYDDFKKLVYKINKKN